MTAYWHHTTPSFQGADQIEQSGRFGSDPPGAPNRFAAGRLDEQCVAGTAGAEAVGLACGLPNRSQFQFVYNLIYKTETGALGAVAGMQVAMSCDGGVVDIGYCIHQVTADGQSPYSAVALTQDVWLGAAGAGLLGPGASWKSFRITGSIKVNEPGGWLRLKFRSVASGLLTAPSAWLNPNSNVLLHEC